MPHRDKETKGANSKKYGKKIRAHGGITVYPSTPLRLLAQQKGMKLSSKSFCDAMRAVLTAQPPACEGCPDRRLVELMKRELAGPTHLPHSSTAKDEQRIRDILSDPGEA